MMKAFVKYLLTFNKTIIFIKSALLESGTSASDWGGASRSLV